MDFRLELSCGVASSVSLSGPLAWAALWVFVASLFVAGRMPEHAGLGEDDTFTALLLISTSAMTSPALSHSNFRQVPF